MGQSVLYFMMFNKYYILLIFLVLVLTGCETPRSYRDDGGSIPWNQPAEWEKDPNIGAQFVW